MPGGKQNIRLFTPTTELGSYVLRGEAMRLIFPALAILLTISPLAEAQGLSQSESRPFSISSLNTAFALQGNFEGEYRVYSDHIELKVTTATILFRRDSPYKGRSLLSSLRLGLATRIDGNRWKPANMGQEVSLEQMMRPGAVYSLGELHLYIPIDDSVDLSKHWLVAQMEDIVLDAPGEEGLKGYSFAHSSRDIFTQKR